MAARESEAAAEVTVQVLITARSAPAAEATISCPAARNWHAIDSISAWFKRQPIMSKKIFIALPQMAFNHKGPQRRFYLCVPSW
jgi:hypothetical protein